MKFLCKEKNFEFCFLNVWFISVSNKRTNKQTVNNVVGVKNLFQWFGIFFKNPRIFLIQRSRNLYRLLYTHVQYIPDICCHYYYLKNLPESKGKKLKWNELRLSFFVFSYSNSCTHTFFSFIHLFVVVISLKFFFFASFKFCHVCLYLCFGNEFYRHKRFG